MDLPHRPRPPLALALIAALVAALSGCGDGGPPVAAADAPAALADAPVTAAASTTAPPTPGSSSPSPSTTTAPSTTAPSTTAAGGAGAAHAATAPADPRALLEHFAGLWAAGDLSAIDALADPQVLEAVRAAGPVTSVTVLWEPTCLAGSLGSGSCDLEVSAGGPPTLLTADYVIDPVGGSYLEWLQPATLAG